MRPFLRWFLLCYFSFCIVGKIAGMIAFIIGRNLDGALPRWVQLVVPAGCFFGWTLYYRFVMWLGRKPEAKFLALVQAVLSVRTPLPPDR